MTAVNNMRQSHVVDSQVVDGTTRRTRVGFISQWYAPEPSTVPVWIAETLVRSGFEVQVLTGQPNLPTGKIYPGYSASKFASETINGIAVQRCPLYPSHDRSAIRRMANYLSWAVTAAAAALVMLRGVNVTLVYSSPATAALPAMLRKLFRRTPYVLMIQDLWPDSILSTGFLKSSFMRRAAERIMGAFVGWSYSFADHIVVISPGMIDILVSRGVPRAKLSLVYNWVDETVFQPCDPHPTFRSDLGVDPDTFLLMYAGNFGPAQALDGVIRAVAMLEETEKVVLVLLGEGVEEAQLRRLAKDVAPGRVLFAPPVPASEVPPLMAAADVQLLSLRDEPLFRHTMPSKVQSILACGHPAIACAPGDAGAVIVDSGAGWHAQPGDPRNLVECIRLAMAEGAAGLRSRGAAARHHYQSVMSEESNAQRLTAILRASAQRPDRSGPRASPVRPARPAQRESAGQEPAGRR
jgi:colanic acid biosynthesis glycosyl transferase WcaI